MTRASSDILLRADLSPDLPRTSRGRAAEGTDRWTPAATAARTAAPTLRSEWVPLADLDKIREPWADLARRALTPNVFYEPGFALAAAPAWGRDVGAVLVWSAENDGAPRLLGFFPARAVARRYGLRRPLLVGWTHPYAPLGVPLVDRNAARAVLAAWLDAVAQHPSRPRGVLLPLVPGESAFAQALAATLAERGVRAERFGLHCRAVLHPRDASDADPAGAIGTKKRKELRRQLRRLEAGGDVSWNTAEGPGWRDALRDYKRVEARGWKGRAGTAMALDPAAGCFVEGALGALAAAGQVRIDRLCVGERTIAAAVTLRSGDAGWFWKIAYDEDAARASPGVQLALELTRSFVAEGALGQVDSCATADHPMIDHLWRGRMEIADYLVAAPGARPFGFAFLCALERARRYAEKSAKAVLGLTRARAARGG